jgi:RNA polymerase sigma factor (sigma-70 family)
MLDVSADQGTFTRCIRLVIADRQPIVLQGLKSVFAAQRDFDIVASCSTATSCLEAIRNLLPDVALLANTLPDLMVSEILAIAKAETLSTRLVFFTECEGDDDLTAAIAAGACSAISKYANLDTMLRSLRLMTQRISGSPEQSQDLSPYGKKVDGAKIEKMLGMLTHRERQIVQLVCDGLSNKEIARQLDVSRGTVSARHDRVVATIRRLWHPCARCPGVRNFERRRRRTRTTPMTTAPPTRILSTPYLSSGRRRSSGTASLWIPARQSYSPREAPSLR